MDDNKEVLSSLERVMCLRLQFILEAKTLEQAQDIARRTLESAMFAKQARIEQAHPVITVKAIE